MNHINLFYSYSEKDENYQEEDLKKSIDVYKEVVVNSEGMSDKPQISTVYNNLGAIYSN